MTKHARLYGPLASIIATALLAGAASPALAGGVTAGTLIENTATANFDEAGTSRSVDSNTVTVRVDELLDVTVTSLDTGPITARRGDAVLTFEVTNPGNGPEAFRLTAEAAVAGNDFDVTVRGVAIDSNGNGTYDDGVDQILTGPLTTPVLAPDARVTVFVLVTVPDAAADGDTSNVQLTAAAVTGNGTPGTAFAGEGQGGGDAVVGSTGALANARGQINSAVASVQLVKSVTLRDPFGGTSAVPGSVATFTIEARVSGSGNVANLVVTDAIPAGTTYVPGTLALDAGALTDAADADAGTASGSSGISVTLGSVAADTNRSITFNVTVDQ
ncbi:DUF11 domain-containing protein [Porphyrobacter sp. AAP82]|uniref:DUF11 domain-containing protein n=1 Tax=Porphyrobacter sp. AAP82 TaxID=1248917 RepID=UPI00031CFF3C|nr:DUF11 domain-containing protein [Porphyrobacter sp. AAP82]